MALLHFCTIGVTMSRLKLMEGDIVLLAVDIKSGELTILLGAQYMVHHKTAKTVFGQHHDR